MNSRISNKYNKDSTLKETSIDSKIKLIPNYASTKFSKSIRTAFLKNQTNDHSGKRTDANPKSDKIDLKSRNIQIIKSSTSNKKEYNIDEIQQKLYASLEENESIFDRMKSLEA